MSSSERSCPSGWRPTAFYRRVGESDAMTHAAQVDGDGYPLRQVSDVRIGDGIMLHGPWLLVRYDEKWGHAEYGRPDGYVEPYESYRLAGMTNEPRPSPWCGAEPGLRGGGVS